MKKVDIYTDGACSGNPGAGGWAGILIYKNTKKEISGFEANTTNNRMELTAVIESLSRLKEPCEVTVHTDSKYVCDAVNKNWLFSWVNHDWKKSDKKPVLNVDLWQKFLSLYDTHKVKFIWVKGHDGNPLNERCDELAVEQYKNHSK